MIRLLADFSLRTKASPRIRDGLAGELIKAAHQKGWSVDLLIPPNSSLRGHDGTKVNVRVVPDRSDFVLEEVVIPRISRSYDLLYTQREGVRLTGKRPKVVLHLHEHCHTRYTSTPTLKLAARRAWQGYRAAKIYRFADHICFSSGWTRDEFKRLEGTEQPSHSVVPLAGWPERLPRARYGSRDPAVVVVASQDLRDELSWGLEVWERAKLPAPWELVVVGGAQAIGNRIRLLGRISDEELMRTFSRSRAYLHIGRVEGFGLSVVEALQLGTPVVARRGSAVDEILESGGGYLVEDARSAADALVRIADEMVWSGAAVAAGDQYHWRNTALGVLDACESALWR